MHVLLFRKMRVSALRIFLRGREVQVDVPCTLLHPVTLFAVDIRRGIKAGCTKSAATEICMLNVAKSFIWAPGDVTAAPRTALKRRARAHTEGSSSLAVRLFIFRRCLNYRKIELSIFPSAAAAGPARRPRFFRALQRALFSGFSVPQETITL